MMYEIQSIREGWSGKKKHCSKTTYSDSLMQPYMFHGLDSEDLCLHQYSNQLNSLHPPPSPINFPYAHNTRQDILKILGQQTLDPEITSACIKLSAAAEKRQHDKVEKLQEELNRISHEKDEIESDTYQIMAQINMLKNQILEKDELVHNLENLVNMKDDEIKNNIDEIEMLRSEIDYLIKDNQSLKVALHKWTQSYHELEMSIMTLPSVKLYNEKIAIINQLKESLAETKAELSIAQENVVTADMTKQNLEEKLFLYQMKLTNENKEDISVFKNKVTTLLKENRALEKKVATLQTDLEQKATSQQKLIATLANLREEKYSDRIHLLNTFKDHIRHQERTHKSPDNQSQVSSVSKVDAVDLSVKQVNSGQSNNNQRTDEEGCSEELMDEMSQLQSDVLKNQSHIYSHEPALLIRRIKRIKTKILAKIDKEEAKRECLNEKICCYRYEFAEIQSQIEKIRSSGDKYKAKEEINIRVRREKDLSISLDQTEEQRKHCLHKLSSLKKAISNIGKVEEFVSYIT